MSTPTRYPDYDVLRKRQSPSWDEVTRSVIDERLKTPSDPCFLDAVQWRALEALCACIVPQDRQDRPPVPLAGMLDQRLHKNSGDGFRHARLPPLRDAWRIGLAALDAESKARHELPFASLDHDRQVALLKQLQHGEVAGSAWHGMDAQLFFTQRVLPDICGAYYSHPYAWSEIGFGGPANPRGYVRMYYDRRDPWEAVEAKPGQEQRARRENRRVR
ncbi:gluconate 2-dehydrogenase subunit 3 family protein [Dyella jejuensis]|uniref:Gluconate 2-dehydrogenase subunit 3 family protein n=1 Tax=Dyella jejuensis TaxID=1432009 RepID=A0ABW8JII3_9GAMM